MTYLMKAREEDNEDEVDHDYEDDDGNSTDVPTIIDY